MSQQIARAYKQFLKNEQKRQTKMADKMTASSGLLARRSAPAKKDGQQDQMDTLITFVNEIRKYGAPKDNG
jgi:hypothetical protein